jgi:membrane dipeptidase
VAAKKTPIIDGLNCAVFNRAQFERTIAGRVGALNLTALRPSHDLAASMGDLAKVLRIIAENADLVEVVTSVRDIRRVAGEGRLGIILGTQNSTFLEHDLDLLRVMQRIGFRILQPCYMEQNALGSGVLAETPGGVTEAGERWVELMNETRMLIDLSHVGARTVTDIAARSKRPVILSHTNAHAICPSRRNMPDEVIRAVCATGGTVGITTWPPIGRHAARPTLDDVYAHIDHMVNLVGIEHVAFGSDLSEAAKTEDEWKVTFGPRGMYPEVTGMVEGWFTFADRFTRGYDSMALTGALRDGLVAHGYSEDDADRIMSGNLLRVYGEVWGE